MNVYTVRPSQQSEQGLYYLSFSAVWSRSILSFWAVWSGSSLFASHSSLIKVKVNSHPQEQSDQGLHYLPFSAILSWSTLFRILSKQYYHGFTLCAILSSLIRIYTVCHTQQSDQSLNYLSFSSLWWGSTQFAMLSSLNRLSTICYPQSHQGLQFVPYSAVWSGSTLSEILSKRYYQGLHCAQFWAVWS